MFNQRHILIQPVWLRQWWTRHQWDLRETFLFCPLLLPSLSLSFFFPFQQNSLLPPALWFSPPVQLNIRSRPFPTMFFSLSPQVAGGGEGSQWQIEIFSLNRPTPRAVKSLQVGCAVRCLEYVPEPSPSEEVEAGVHRAPTGSGANICVGLDDGRWDTDIDRKKEVVLLYI